MSHIFATLSEFERDIIRERTKAGLEAARACGRKGGRVLFKYYKPPFPTRVINQNLTDLQPLIKSLANLF